MAKPEWLADLVGLLGLGLVCAGVAHQWGLGWTLITAGVPLVAAYVWREWRGLRAPRRS